MIAADEHVAAVAGLAYATLRLPRTATPADIRHAYRRCAFIAHPDKPKGDTKQFIRVRQAFEVLTDPVRRVSLCGMPEPEREITPAVPALPDVGLWIIRKRFHTQEEANTFVQQCQPFDFTPEESGTDKCTTFQTTIPDCERRWRVRQDGNGYDPWVAEQEGEVFARLNSAAVRARIVPPLAGALYIGIPEAQVAKVLEEGYRTSLRRGIPCSATPARACAAAKNAAVSSAAALSVGQCRQSTALSAEVALDRKGEPKVVVLRVGNIPAGIPIVRRPDGGYLMKTDRLPASSLSRICASLLTVAHA